MITAPALPTTALYAGLFGLTAVGLANLVLWGRLGSRNLPSWQPEALLRVQGNFVENVPLALVMLVVLEGAPPVALHVLGASLLLLRLLHAWGLGFHAGANYPRLIGAQGTFVVLAIMGVALVVSATP